MPRLARTLTVKEIEQLKGNCFPIGGVKGLYCDYRHARPHYFLRWKAAGKSRTKFYPNTLSLKSVRALAQEHRAKLDQGIDIIAEELEKKKKLAESELRKQQEACTVEKTFLEWFPQYSRLKGWENNREHKRKLQLMSKHVFPKIGSVPVGKVTARLLADKVMIGLFATSKSADKVEPLLRAFFNQIYFSKQYGLESHPMQEDYKELVRTAKDNAPEEKHLPYLDPARMPEFVSELLKHQTGRGHLALVFSILTAARSQAVRLAEWQEFDLENGIWIIPREHDKNKAKLPKDRTILLSRQAVEIIKRLKEINQVLATRTVFFNSRFNILSGDSFAMLIKKMHRKSLESGGAGWYAHQEDKSEELNIVTQHGAARSTFRTWAGDDRWGNNEKYPWELCERCLLHQVGNKVSRAYNHAELLEARRRLMQEWGDFCLKGINLEDYLPKIP